MVTRAGPRHPGSDIQVQQFSPEEGRRIFDEAAQFYLHMSGDEFLAAWDSGRFRDDPDLPRVMDVVMLLDLVRPERD